jgi:cytoskeletal protein CcmA (bactofilin family)
MAIFNPQGSAKKDTTLPFGNSSQADAPVREPTPAIADFAPVQTPTPTPRAPAQPQLKESLIAADLTIEGKISGSGHVRIAGKFKGDVNVEGDLTIESGAKLNGGVRAQRVTVAGELEGNIESASRVELQQSSALLGDVKAGTLTVAAGARIRGNVECGWGDETPARDDKGKGAKDKAGLDLVP